MSLKSFAKKALSTFVKSKSGSTRTTSHRSGSAKGAAAKQAVKEVGKVLRKR